MVEMTVLDRLDAFRVRYAGCLIVVFADLSTGMVLASSAREKTTQERLDDLCKAAVDSFGTWAARSDPNGRCALPSARHAIVFAADVLTCFIRSPLLPHEALCVQCAASTPVQDLIAEGTDLLTQMEQEAS